MIVVDLPKPPSSNNLFPTGKHGKRFLSPEYKSWREDAGWRLKQQLSALRRRNISGPVSLKYEIEKGRADLGNMEKAITDLLVGYCVIDGDGPGVVVDIHLKFANVEGARVTVSPAV